MPRHGEPERIQLQRIWCRVCGKQWLSYRIDNWHAGFLSFLARVPALWWHLAFGCKPR